MKYCKDKEEHKKEILISKEEVKYAEENLYDNEDKIIDSLKTKVIYHDSIACELIEHFNDEKFEKRLLDKCFYRINRILNDSNCSLNEKGRALVIVAMTFIALKYYDSGNLETPIYNLYCEYCSKNNVSIKPKEIFLKKGFYWSIHPNKSLEDYREFTKYKDKKSYVAVPLVLSVVPHYKMSDLFVFAKDIYKVKLLFSDELEDDEIAEKVEEALLDLRASNLITDNYDDSKIGDYYLCQFTKCCINTGKCLDALVTILSYCIRLIINYLTLPEDAYEVLEFYHEGFNLWKQSFAEKDIFEKNAILSKPIFYTPEGKNIHIKTGQHTMDVRFNPNDVRCVLLENNIPVKELRLNNANDIEYGFKNNVVSCYIIKPIDMVVTCNPLNNISYELYCGQIRIYRSKTILFRKNLFFDERGFEIKPGHNYDGELKVATRNLQEENDDDQTHLLYKFESYYIYSAFVDSQTTYQFDDNCYAFFKIEKPEMLGYAIPWAILECENKKYNIYKDQSYVFRTSAALKDIVYILDGEQRTNEDNDENISVEVYCYEHNEYNTYVIKMRNLEAGFHSLRIFNKNTKDKIVNDDINFISDSNFKRIVERGESGNIFTYNSNIFDGEKKIEYEYGCTSKTINLFVPNLGYSKIIFFPSDFAYTIDGDKWFDRDKKIMLCDIANSIDKIKICGPNEASAFYLDEDLNKHYLNLSKTDDDYTYYLYLSHLRNLMFNGIREKRVYFEAGAKAKYVLVRLVPYGNKDLTNIVYNDLSKEYKFQIYFDGGKNVYAKIFNIYNPNKIFCIRKIASGDTIVLNENDINDDIDSLSVSLHMYNYNSLLQEPFEKAFYTFEKFDLPNRQIILNNDSDKNIIKLSDDNKHILVKVNFSGAKNLRVIICPTGKTFEGYSLFDGLISNGEEIQFNIEKQIFNSYFIRVLKPYGDIKSKSLIHKIINYPSCPYLGKRFKVLSYVKSGTVCESSHELLLVTKTILKITDNIYLISATLYKDGVRNIYDSLLDVEEITDTTITFRLCGEMINDGRPISKPGTLKLIVQRSNENEKSN